MNWTTWVLFVGLLWIYPVCILAGGKIDTAQDLRRCLKNTTHFVIADNFSGFISTENQWNGTHDCILFLKNNTERPEKFGNIFPQMEESNGYRMLHVSKEYTQLAERLYVLEGKQCISTLFVHHDSCRIKCVDTVRCQQSIYNETICKQSVLWVKGEYIIDIESDGCFTCNNPVKLPEDNIKLDSILPNEGGKPYASEAADVMYKTADFAASINGPSAGGRIDTAQDLRRCLKNTTHFVIADNFSGFISTENQWNGTHNCILFLKNNTERPEKFGNIFPQMEESNGYRMLHVSKEYTQLAERLYVLEGKQCISTLFVHHESCENFNFSMPDSCRIKCVDKVRFQQSIYNETICKQSVLWVKGEYIIDIESDGCFTCNNPVKLPEDNIKLDSILPNEGGKLDASEAADVMNKMADLAASINGSSAAVTLGEEASGILVRQADPKDFYEISFGYGSQKDNIYIVENQDNLSKFSRSVTLPKEAFEKTASLNVSVPFVAVLRFINLASDEKNSNLLGNEVIAVEMGTAISNLTDKITLNYKMVDYDGMLSCHSWNGVGKQPKWTDDGCLTKKTGDTVMCKCSHLTFFAVLLAPPNQTLSTSDLNSLTIITQVGCGLSMFFLSIVLFMHALLRRTKASAATKILIQLVSAMFLLNLTFLINDFVAKLKNSVACRIVAVLMHYFMLTTFSWFAVQAFHLCLNLYTGGQIVIRHYILKVSITSWVLPSVVGIVLLILGKYGEQVISTNDSEYNVTMCWITDSNVHYIVNIGYYVLVFLFTFTTFIITVYWLFCLKRVGRATSSTGIGPKRKGIAIILGLCCLMGITWGFAFFAYGVLRIPSYYIFTVLNSLQGFFLFIYYYNTSQQEEILSSQGSSSGTLTVQSNVHSDNPYDNIKE